MKRVAALCAWLVLDCVVDGASTRFSIGFETADSMWGKAVILPSRDGAAFVDHFANAFRTNAPPPPARAQALKPIVLNTAVLGADQKRSAEGGFTNGGSWTATKWFLEQNGRYAEVFVNYSVEEKRGEFSEKDPEYRGDLVQEIAWFVRDGMPAPRTPADDPNLTGEGPALTQLQPLPKKGSSFGFDSPTLVHYTLRGADGVDTANVLRVDAPDAPIALYRTKHPIAGMSCGDLAVIRCVVAEVLAKDSSSYTLGEPQQLWLVTPSGKPALLKGTWDPKNVTLWEHSLSPDGATLALTTYIEKPRRAAIQLHDIARGTTTLLSLPNDDLNIHGWDGSTLLLDAGVAYDEKSALARYKVGADRKLAKIEDIARPVKTWDAERRRFFVIEEEKALLIGDQRFVFHPDDASAVVEECCTWLGERILFDGDRPALIDPRTMKMKYIAEPSLHGGRSHLSPDGRWLIYETNDAAWLGRLE